MEIHLFGFGRRRGSNLREPPVIMSSKRGRTLAHRNLLLFVLQYVRYDLKHWTRVVGAIFGKFFYIASCNIYKLSELAFFVLQRTSSSSL